VKHPSKFELWLLKMEGLVLGFFLNQKVNSNPLVLFTG
jgi:hypothetical protein